MGVLRNPKWETFSQEIVKGRPALEAYVTAGYPRNRGNASRLRLHEAIKARIAELMGFKTAAVEAETLTAAEKAGLDAFWVMRTLRRNSVMAARRGDHAASSRAAELIGKHLGMFIEKKSIEISYIDDSDEYLRQLMEIVNAKVIDAEPAPLQLEDGREDGTEYGSDEFH